MYFFALCLFNKTGKSITLFNSYDLNTLFFLKPGQLKGLSGNKKNYKFDL